jgi:hypothetical protein
MKQIEGFMIEKCSFLLKLKRNLYNENSDSILAQL